LVFLAPCLRADTHSQATGAAKDWTCRSTRCFKNKQPEHWAKLEEDLKALYKHHLNEVKPGAASSPEDYIISPSGLKPVIYEQRGDL